MKDFKLICVLTEDQVHPKLWSPGCPQPQNVCISELRVGSRTREGASEPIAMAFLHRCSVYSDNFPSVYITTLISAGNYSCCVLLLLSAIPKDSIFFSKPNFILHSFSSEGLIISHIHVMSFQTFPKSHLHLPSMSLWISFIYDS